MNKTSNYVDITKERGRERLILILSSDLGTDDESTALSCCCLIYCTKKVW